jgi:putative endonuclease
VTKDRKRKAAWHVYIVECRDGSYYTGITTDLQRRLGMHNSGVASRYTRTRRPVRYRYAEARASQSAALKREAEIKGWSRDRKAALFKSARNLLRARTSGLPPPVKGRKPVDPKWIVRIIRDARDVRPFSMKQFVGLEEPPRMVREKRGGYRARRARK